MALGTGSTLSCSPTWIASDDPLLVPSFPASARSASARVSLSASHRRSSAAATPPLSRRCRSSQSPGCRGRTDRTSTRDLPGAILSEHRLSRVRGRTRSSDLDDRQSKTTFSKLRILKDHYILKLDARAACVKRERSRDEVEAVRITPQNRRIVQEVSARP